MDIKQLEFTYKDLLQTLKPVDIRKLVDFKMKEAGYVKSNQLTKTENVTRQRISQRIKEHPEKYETVEYGGFLYAKKK